jgi:hypothetical protein
MSRLIHWQAEQAERMRQNTSRSMGAKASLTQSYPAEGANVAHSSRAASDDPGLLPSSANSVARRKEKYL